MYYQRIIEIISGNKYAMFHKQPSGKEKKNLCTLTQQGVKSCPLKDKMCYDTVSLNWPLMCYDCLAAYSSLTGKREGGSGGKGS